MSFENCKSTLIEFMKANPELSEAIDEELLNRTAKKLENIAKNTPSKAEIAKAFDVVIVEEELRVHYEELAKTDALRKGAELAKTIVYDNAGLNPKIEDTVISIIKGGEVKNGMGVNKDIKSMSRDFEGILSGHMEIALKDEAPIARTGKLDTDIGIALHNIQENLPIPAGINPVALKIAQAYNSVLNRIFEIKSALNPKLEKMSGYIMRQFHDRDKIMLMGKETWVKLADKVFKSPDGMSLEARYKMFGETYDKIVGGTFGVTSDLLKRGGDLTAKYAEERILLPKNAEAFVEYQYKAGQGTLADTMNKIISNSAYELAKMEKFGVNPEQTLTQLEKLITAAVPPEQSLALRDSFKDGAIRKAFKNSIGTYSGSPSLVPMDIPEHAALKLSQLKAITWIARGGASGLRSITDLAFTTNILKSSGIDNVASKFLSGYGSGIVNKAERINSYKIAGTIMEGLVRDTLESHGVSADMSGLLSKGSEKISVWSGLQTHIDIVKGYIGRAAAIQFGEDIKVAFKDLSPIRKGYYDRFGITALDHEFMGRAVEKTNYRGVEVDYVNSSSIFNKLTDADIREYVQRATPDANITPQRLMNARLGLANKIGASINMLADRGSSTPRTLELSTLNALGVDNKTALGQVIGLLTQFKSAGLSNANNYRQLYFEGKIAGNQWLLARTAATVALYGYVGDSLIEMANGRSPQRLDDPKTLLQIAVGSVFPIWGNMAVREILKDGNFSVSDMLYNAAGPSIRTLGTLTEAGVNTTKKLFSEGEQDYSSEKLKLANVATSNVPFNTLPYVTFLFNQYFATAVKDIAKSGTSSKMERAIEKDNRSYLGPKPTESSLFGVYKP